MGRLAFQLFATESSGRWLGGRRMLSPIAMRCLDRWLSAGLVTVTLGLPGAALCAEVNEALSKTYYEFEVAGYCGLVTDRIATGFHSEAQRIIDRERIDNDGLQAARMHAWKAAHAEWQNRGLGGFKNWCRTEGQAAADRFESLTR